VIVTWSKGPADLGMPEQMLTETLQKVRQHPWWHARSKLALAVLRQYGVSSTGAVIDIGCGWGINLDGLESARYSATGLDISRQILQRIDRPERRLVEADLNQPFPEGAGTFDALLALDVIEHVDDDAQVIRRCALLLRPGGIADVSVPARPDLFSEFDRIQGHRRRYLPDRLEQAFAGSSLKVRKIFWWGQWMVPLLSRRRKTSGKDGQDSTATYADYLRLPLWPAPLIMKFLYRWEQPRALRGALHTGTSLFAVAARPSELLTS
jgi:SAM-dependent methyltransferase